MRINKFIAAATGLSRRAADQAVAGGRIRVNGTAAQAGQDVQAQDSVTLDGQAIRHVPPVQTSMLNKPAGYVVSRDGQGSKTIYDLLPPELHHLKPVGRLDKFSSGLLLLSNNGQLAQKLTHPRYQKTKIYEIQLSKALTPGDRQTITGAGVPLADGPSILQLEPLDSQNNSWKITMHQGRNRQIRRTFLALGYGITRLHRTHFGPYRLGDLQIGAHRPMQQAEEQLLG